MKTILLNTDFEIQKAKTEFVEQFKTEYKYYETWIAKNKRDFENGKRVIFKLIADNNIVGYVMINYSSNITAKINGIFIYQQFFNRGFASIALKSILEHLKEKKYEYAMIQTRFTNAKVIHMFDKLGFKIIGKKVHEIEQKDNVVACYDLKCNKMQQQLVAEAIKQYQGFSL
ncbi:MAG: GNAT family N-acetyltransferase [Clostridia bacterium]